MRSKALPVGVTGQFRSGKVEAVGLVVIIGFATFLGIMQGPEALQGLNHGNLFVHLISGLESWKFGLRVFSKDSASIIQKVLVSGSF